MKFTLYPIERQTCAFPGQAAIHNVASTLPEDNKYAARSIIFKTIWQESIDKVIIAGRITKMRLAGRQSAWQAGTLAFFPNNDGCRILQGKTKGVHICLLNRY
jgi:hypothetical protein